MNGRAKPWEVGGDYSWTPLPTSSVRRFPDRSVYFALGRHAVVALLEVFPRIRKPLLWVPSYFCPDVTTYWGQYFSLRFYHDDPRRSEPDFTTLSPEPHDFVVAVNYFGCRTAQPWNEWRRSIRCVLVEDHTHDPASPWALHSRADYVFSSLRKILPIPDGAVMWSPNNRPLPQSPAPSVAPGALEKLSAMFWKAEYLNGNIDAGIKDKYLSMLRESENALHASRVSGISSFSRAWLAHGIPREWRKQREQNVRQLVWGLKGWRAAVPLFSTWPRGGAPLGLVLVFKSGAERTHWRSWLQTQDIYCPIHWSGGNVAFYDSCDLSSRVLTIPTDHRYSIEDMNRVAEKLLVHGAETICLQGLESVESNHVDQNR